MCPNYQGVQVSLYDKAPFGTITKYVWIMQVSLLCRCTYYQAS